MGFECYGYNTVAQLMEESFLAVSLVRLSSPPNDGAMYIAGIEASQTTHAL